MISRCLFRRVPTLMQGSSLVMTSRTAIISCRASAQPGVFYRLNSELISRQKSDSITYSGGQPSPGQGGFYGSGGARALSPDHTVEQQQAKERNKMLAMAHDVQSVRVTMQELELLESLLRAEEKENNATVSPKFMELKNSIKKLMTAPEFLDSLNNLEVQGEPAWGLSCEERELIILAREKVNEC